MIRETLIFYFKISNLNLGVLKKNQFTSKSATYFNL